jgi:hypothetical protein
LIREALREWKLRRKLKSRKSYADVHVMAVLGTAIHTFEAPVERQAWITGPSPVMTRR